MRRRFLSSQKHFDPSNYMTIEVLEDGFYVSFKRDIEYNRNGEGWKTLRADFNSPILNKGEFISFRLALPKGESIGRISSNSKLVNLRGNILSIVFGDNIVSTLEGYDYVFRESFLGWQILNIEKNFLPATTLAENCYRGMFINCTSLTTAPQLPATTLASSCYYGMFYNCSKLNYIKMLATDISATDCLSRWTFGVASTGTFVKNPAMTSLPTGNSGIPEGWTVVNDGEDSGGGNDKDIQGDFPEESKYFGFPLYLNVTKFEEESEWDITYIRYADEISIKFYQWVSELNLGTGDKLVLNEDQSIVINGINIREISNEVGIYLTPTPNGINDLILESSGNLIGYKYK